MRVTFIGHATTRIDVDDAVLLTDPVLRSRVAFLRSTGASDGHTPPAHEPVTVLMSHLHRDHCDLPSLRRLGSEVTLVVPGDTTAFFRRCGFRRVVPLDPGRSCELGHFTITATPADHDGRRWPIGPPLGAVGYVVSAAAGRVYFAGDTDLFDGMKDLDRPDIALLPVWGWGRSLGPGHLDPGRAVQAVELIQPQVAVPIHWGSLRPYWHRGPQSDHPVSPAHEFADLVRERRLSTRVELLLPGQSLCWPDSPSPDDE